jgi:predicted transcriptional regulator
MKLYSTTQAAKQLGITPKSLSRYIAAKKVPTPQVLESGKITHHVWTEEEVENLRQLLPKIANGRKTRYKKHSAVSTQQSAKAKAQPRAAVPHRKRKPKKK